MTKSDVGDDITYFNTCAFMALSGSEFGTTTNRAGQKTISVTKAISVTISFLCHRVIALIKAQVCDKYIHMIILLTSS